MFAASLFRRGGAGVRRQMTSGSMRSFSTEAAAESSPPLLDSDSWMVIGAVYVGTCA